MTSIAYRARSGFLAPWQAEILAAWRHARATERNVMVLSKATLRSSLEHEEAIAWFDRALKVFHP